MPRNSIFSTHKEIDFEELKGLEASSEALKAYDLRAEGLQAIHFMVGGEERLEQVWSGKIA